MASLTAATDLAVYPGFGAACNRCGLCCLTAPCDLARKFRLWTRAGCRALTKEADGRYQCEAIRDPARIGLTASKRDRLALTDSTGFGCGHRAGWSVDEVREALRKRRPREIYPITAVLHQPGGPFGVRIASVGMEPTVEAIDNFPRVDAPAHRMPLSTFRPQSSSPNAARWLAWVVGAIFVSLVIMVLLA